MLNLISNKRIKFVLVSALISGLLFYSKDVPASSLTLFLSLTSFLAFFLTVYVLEAWKFKKSWFYLIILPTHFIIGISLTYFGFPNLSLLFRILTSVILFIVYNIILLLLNIFVVVMSKEKSIPLYRVAITWSQIMIVVVSIPLFSGIFKLPIHPFLQLFSITVSAFLLVLFYLWTLDLEVGSLDVHFAVLASFWTLLMGCAIIFFPFEAVFRGLFLSSVVLFGIGYIHNYIKHTLSNRILLEYILITVGFLFIALLFIP